MKKLVFALGVLTLSACARPVTPEGGPKDTTPPQVVKEKSTPNETVRFAERQISLSFDEWVTLQDVGTQVLISPPLAKRPEITLKGKTVLLRFDKAEVLRPNTTYTINFGTAVKDLHENNPAKDLRFVFSTGDFIDSFSVAGVVQDAFTGEAVENMAVLLYDIPDDSIVRKERPYYLARTDKNGQFTIPNVRAGSFKCVVVDDVNQNLKWDGDNERIGFRDDLIQVSDSTRGAPALKLFKPAPPLRLLSQNATRYGLVKMGFTRRPDSVDLQVDLPGLDWKVERVQDSLFLWYDRPDSTAWKLIAGGKDTVPVKALSRADFLAKNRLFFADDAPESNAAGRRRGNQPTPATNTPRPPKTVFVRPGKPTLLPFNNPVATVDTAKWALVLDSIPLRSFVAAPDSSGIRALRLDLAWTGGKMYQLTLFPGAVTDMFGTSNTDTLRRAFNVQAEKQLGGLNLTVQNVTPGQHYVLQLLNGNTLEEERFFTADSSEIRLLYKNLPPANYSVQLIEDRNGNRRWDTGDYFAHRQPEKVIIQKLEALRANWELEAILEADPERSGRRKKD